MIPKLTLDIDFIESTWKEKKDQEFVKNDCDCVPLKNGIEVHDCDDMWVEIGVFKEFKKVIKKLVFYGYCDTEDALLKFIQQYEDDKEKNYFVEVGGLSMNNEKYYKWGSYINKDGENTHNDYWDWIREHPEDKNKQEFKGKWIRFAIHEIGK